MGAVNICEGLRGADLPTSEQPAADLLRATRAAHHTKKSEVTKWLERPCPRVVLCCIGGQTTKRPRVGTSEIDPQQGAGAAPKHTFRGGLREADMGDQGRATAPVPIWERHASRPASARPKPNSIVDTDDPRFPYAAARAW